MLLHAQVFHLDCGVSGESGEWINIATEREGRSNFGNLLPSWKKRASKDTGPLLYPGGYA